MRNDLVGQRKCSIFVGGKEKNNTMNRIILVGNGFDLVCLCL